MHVDMSSAQENLAPALMHAQMPDAASSHLDAVLINRFGQVRDVHLSIQCKGCCTLDQPFNLSSAEILGLGCRAQHLSMLPKKHDKLIMTQHEYCATADP